ncbi:MAG: hypothetical protein HQK77_15390 [Desulfobacterales bacterium]|nr:hypothetical protein [Desulfobacterales bacterium]
MKVCVVIQQSDKFILKDGNDVNIVSFPYNKSSYQSARQELFDKVKELGFELCVYHQSGFLKLVHYNGADLVQNETSDLGRKDREEKINILGWSVQFSNGYYRAHKRINGKLKSIYLGKNLNDVEKKIELKSNITQDVTQINQLPVTQVTQPDQLDNIVTRNITQQKESLIKDITQNVTQNITQRKQFQCIFCGKIFTSKKDVVLYCSKECNNKALRQKKATSKEATCLVCGKVFTAKRTGVLYCSKVCNNKALRKKK